MQYSQKIPTISYKAVEQATFADIAYEKIMANPPNRHLRRDMKGVVPRKTVHIWKETKGGGNIAGAPNG